MTIPAREMDTEATVADVLNAVMAAIDLDVATPSLVYDPYGQFHFATLACRGTCRVEPVRHKSTLPYC
jgi:hypothetical protein